MVSFDDTTVKSLEQTHFQLKIIKFVLFYIPTFDTKIHDMKENKKVLSSVKNSKFTTCVTKKMVTEDQYFLPWQHTAN